MFVVCFLCMFQVERVSYKELDFHNFFHKYALGRRPVIITGIVDKMTAVPWDLQHIRDMAGSNKIFHVNYNI